MRVIFGAVSPLYVAITPQGKKFPVRGAIALFEMHHKDMDYSAISGAFWEKYTNI